MPTATKIIDIATELYDELGNPSDTSVSSVRYWLSTNIGLLNNLIYTDYTITTGADISPQLGEQEKSIYKRLYYLYYYDFKIRTSFTSILNNDDVIQVDSNGARVTRINRNEVTKTLLQAKKTELEELDKLVNSYKMKQASPLQVCGDDEEVGDSGQTRARDE